MTRQENPETERLLDRFEGFVIAVVPTGAFLEVVNAPRAYAWLVDLLALAAVAAVGAALAAASADGGLPPSSPTVPASHRDARPTAPTIIVRHEPGAAIAQPGAGAGGRPRPRPRPELTPSGPSGGAGPILPPCFGAGSPAHDLPWRIPHRSAPHGIAADQAQVGSFAIRAASVVGPGHRCESGEVQPRQDAYRIGRSLDSRYAILAVADGLSSGRLSDIGAAAAASQLVRVLREKLDQRAGIADLDAAALFREVAQHVAKEAGARKATGSDLATVLIAAVLEEPAAADGAARVWVAWVGDSSGWVLDPGTRYWARGFGEAKNTGEFASNAVSGHLPDAPDTVRQEEFRLGPDQASALVTDGIADAWSAAGPVNGYFAEHWRQPPAAADFLNDVGFDAAQRLDDRTAVAVWNTGPR